MQQADTVHTPVVELRPARKPDPTNPLRQRRHRQKNKSGVTPKAKKPALQKSEKTSNIKPNVTPTVSRNAAVRALQRQAGTAMSVGVVAAILTTLSLTHLASGITAITGASPWEGWAMAIGIDLAFVALELAQLAVMSDKVRRQVAQFARPAIVVTLVGSAAMNAFAFAGRYITIDPIATMVAAVVLGVAIPALIYALTRVGAAIAADCHARA